MTLGGWRNTLFQTTCLAADQTLPEGEWADWPDRDSGGEVPLLRSDQKSLRLESMVWLERELCRVLITWCARNHADTIRQRRSYRPASPGKVGDERLSLRDL